MTAYSIPAGDPAVPGRAVAPRRRRGLRRRAQSALVIFAATGLPLWLSGCGPAPTADQRADIILITLDTTRADRIGCYGCEFASTPVLDAFAGTATRFRDASAHIAMTLTSHTTMLTGLTQLEHGVHRNSSYFLREEFVTLAELLKARGYDTAAFLSSYALAPQYGLSQGFDVYLSPEKEQDGRITTAQATEWLAAREDSASLLLWVHYWEPHDPYTPPEPFAAATRGIPYDAEISYMDSLLGRLLDALRAQGRYASSHVIIIGDHGEGLFDHDEEFHSLLIYDSTVRVPFFWKLPGQTKGRTADPVVGCVDITPTLCDYLSLDPGVPLEGLSLRRTIEKGLAPDREGIYLGSLVPYLAFEWSPLHAWRTREWKFIACPQPELYHIPSDPGELDNRIAQEPAVATQLRADLDAYLAKHDRLEMFTSARHLSKQERERMASLGYIINEPRPAASGGLETGSPDAASHPAGSGLAGSPFAGLPNPATYIHLENEFEQMRDGRTEGDWPSVLDASQIILRDHPDSGQAVFAKGLAMLNLGRRQEAYEWLSSRKHLLGTDAQAWETLGEAALSVGAYDEASGAYERVPMGSLRTMLHARQKIAAFTGAGRTREALLLVDQVAMKFAALEISQAMEDLRAAIAVIDRHGLEPRHDRPAEAGKHMDALIDLGLWEEAERGLNRLRSVLGSERSAHYERILNRRAMTPAERRSARQERRRAQSG